MFSISYYTIVIAGLWCGDPVQFLRTYKEPASGSDTFAVACRVFKESAN